MLVVAAGLWMAAPAPGEQAGSALRGYQAGLLEAGLSHTCAVLRDGTVRCWGSDSAGQLGYGSPPEAIGDNETPASVATVALGTDRTAHAIAAGNDHTCALLDDGTVRCWGSSASGQLGYGNRNNVGDDELADSGGPVALGAGRRAIAITAGSQHTCALLDDRTVRCWGSDSSGQLGYGSPPNDIGDDETPGAEGPVPLGPGRTAVAIAAGGDFTCALLDDGTVRCWGSDRDGQLGYGSPPNHIGDDETPDAAGPVPLGSGRTAVAIAAGGSATCAVLDEGSVRCWGAGALGQLGYGNQNTIGDNETPDAAGPVSLGSGRSAVAIAAGNVHTCALLDTGKVRCWGYGFLGRLGYGNQNNIGDNETPETAGPVALGSGRTALAIAAGGAHTCALLDNGRVHCWGSDGAGQLGYGSPQRDIGDGDEEAPGSFGPVNLGGLPAAQVADVSLTLLANAASVRVAERMTLTARLSNAGPDPALGLAVGLVLSPELAFVAAVPSSGTTFTGDRWRVETLEVDGSTTLTIFADAVVPGTASASVQMLTGDTVDPGSRPGSGGAGGAFAALQATVTCLGVPGQTCREEPCRLAAPCDPVTGLCPLGTPKTNGLECNDANPCTGTDMCQDGACVGGNPVVCPMIDQCRTPGVCDRLSGACVNSVPTPGGECSAGGQPGFCDAQGRCDASASACGTPAEQCTTGECCTDRCRLKSASEPCGGAPPACHLQRYCNERTADCPSAGGLEADDSLCAGDDNQCTLDDRCRDGACVPGPEVCSTEVSAPKKGRRDARIKVVCQSDEPGRCSAVAEAAVEPIAAMASTPEAEEPSLQPITEPQDKPLRRVRNPGRFRYRTVLKLSLNPLGKDALGQGNVNAQTSVKISRADGRDLSRKLNLLLCRVRRKCR